MLSVHFSKITETLQIFFPLQSKSLENGSASSKRDFVTVTYFAIQILNVTVQNLKSTNISIERLECNGTWRHNASLRTSTYGEDTELNKKNSRICEGHC